MSRANKPKKSKPARVKWEIGRNHFENDYSGIVLIDNSGTTRVPVGDLVKHLNRLERKIRRLEGR